MTSVFDIFQKIYIDFRGVKLGPGTTLITQPNQTNCQTSQELANLTLNIEVNSC